MAVSDIIVSPAKIYVAPVGEALPDETTVAAGAAWGGNWESLGYTLTPVSVNVETETFDLMVEQSIVPVRTIRTGGNYTFSTTLAEMTGDNLGLILDATVTPTGAGAEQKAFDLVEVDATKADVSLYAFGIEGIRVHSTNARLPVRMFIPQGSIVASGEITFAKGAGAGLPVTIKALSPSNGKALIIHNVTAPASS